MNKQFLFTVVYSFIAFYSTSTLAQAEKTSINQIRNEFNNPSDIARTKLWWFHGETETTREGITADLEAFKREGVGGVVYYDQVHGNGKNALLSFSPAWWEMFRFAAAEAKRLGLTFETHLSDGYVSGGPWITEDLSMQRLDATDTLVNGGKLFNGKLPAPQRKNKSGIVRDVAVMAFPVPEGNWETSLNQLPKVSSNVEQLNTKELVFSTTNKLTNIPVQKGGSSVYINLEFKKFFTARSITYRVRAKGKSRTGAMNMPGPTSENFYGYGYVKQPDFGQMEVSEDGVKYTKVCDLKPIYESPTWNQKTISFPAVKGKYFRLNLHDWSNPKDVGEDLPLGNVIISSQAKTDQWEEKAALNSEYVEKNNTPLYSKSAVIDPKKIVDLTTKMKDGQLEWNVPAGKWVIMRFVRVPIGVSTKHGRANFKGLESDKLSAKATTVQWNSYFKVMQDSLKKVGIPLTGLHMDSHEAGSQNWTEGFENKFKQLRGYDIHKYLPALLGYIVGSKEETSGFLYDMRLTLSDLVSDEYFGTLDSLCRKAGVVFTAQAVGNGLTMVADNFKAKGRVEKPQGEFWAYQTHGSYDVKETSSAAHIYGKPIASAEAFTDLKFSQSLADAKNVADYAYAFGAQEFVVCASAYQPWLDKIPGSTGGGRQYVLNRNNTYWNYSKPFWDYQARCAALMRNGISVADLCIYLGENAPVKLLANRLPQIPEGYDFDVCTKDALITRMSAKDGRIVLPDGVNYQILILPDNGDISLEALRQIAKMVKDGVPVYGARPLSSGSLNDAVFANEYQTLVSQLWDKTQTGTKIFGKGRVYWGMTLAEVLSKQNIKPDAGFKSGNIVTDKLYFAHRSLGEGIDIYFLNNHSKNVFKDSIRLRTNVSNAEYWDPTTGKQYSLPVAASGKDGLLVDVVLQSNESGFIVTTDGSSSALPLRWNGVEEKVTEIEGDWKVFFDPNKGGPGEVIFSELTDWSKNIDDRIKYYSGTAIYKKYIQFDKLESSEQVLLRFPELGAIARVIVNGKTVSTVWCSPWEADITSYIQNGKNTLEIEVVNSLTNRMVGDSSLPQSKRFTYAFPEVANPNTSLVSSGIINQVLLVKRLK
ncbi:Glycosyl hydrolases family 2, sugar binding domain [Flavobacterium aquidurense]|uniref:Glycosyl hydrolase family 2 n=1 Tax=Flavobacterium frigidimaris TaxID=262320 RepID=A0ABX4BMA1_FLAFR|nr:glycosyl hydrolase [Flavobacterium frigidimaris]OXA76716.1 glycosyl hydrolase family 2 [Flavobacterium frigidimaris]SDZ66287.1 Glycosyl hydrolases family 2, sugar binding domain [Flavobacterium aquidurense]